MDHVRADAERGQDDEGEVVVCRHDDAVARAAGVFGGRARAVDRAAHLGRGEDARLSVVGRGGADCDLQVFVRGLREGFVVEEADDHPAGLVFDGRKTRGVHFFVFAVPAARRAVPVHVGAV